MDNQETKSKSAPTPNTSQAEIMASAADQLADIIYQAIKYREKERMDLDPTCPLMS